MHLGMGEQITMLLILMLTSKGMAGVPRASMVVIAATLNQFNIPEAGLILLMGVDPFLDMGRSATNVMSNAMGAAIVGRWEGEHYGEGCRGTAPVKNPSRSVLPAKRPKWRCPDGKMAMNPRPDLSGPVPLNNLNRTYHER